MIVCFALISFSLLLTNKYPATGYESSIYHSTPSFLWFSLFASIFIGISVIILQIYMNNYKNYLWVYAFLLLLISYTSCLSLSTIKGYYMWQMNGDPSVHLMHILTIINECHINTNLFYPITHIYTFSILKILNLDIVDAFRVIPLIFAILSPYFTYNLSKSVLSHKGQIIIATVISTFLLHGWYLNLTPNHLANLYFPLLLFIILKSATKIKFAWKILGLIMVFFYPLFHPVPTMALIIIIASLMLPTRNFSISNRNKIQAGNLLQINCVLLLIILVWSITWISSFGVWEITIKNIYSLIMEESSSNIDNLKNQINYAQGYGYSVSEQIIKVIGGEIFHAILALGSFFIFWSKRFEEKFNLIFSLYIPFILIGILMVVIYFFNLMFGPLRLLIYLDIFSTLFVGLLYYYALEKIKMVKKRHVRLLSIFIIILLLTLVNFSGILKLYPSPYILKTNPYTPEADIQGTSWLFEKQNLDVGISGISLPKYKLSFWLLDSEERSIHKIPRIVPAELKVPYHFGYENNTSLSDSYKDDVYLILTEQDKHIYTDVYPEMASIRWELSDFNKIDYDKNVYSLYDSGGIDIYYIQV